MDTSDTPINQLLGEPHSLAQQEEEILPENDLALAIDHAKQVLGTFENHGNRREDAHDVRIAIGNAEENLNASDEIREQQLATLRELMERVINDPCIGARPRDQVGSIVSAVDGFF